MWFCRAGARACEGAPWPGAGGPRIPSPSHTSCVFSQIGFHAAFFLPFSFFLWVLYHWKQSSSSYKCDSLLFCCQLVSPYNLNNSAERSGVWSKCHVSESPWVMGPDWGGTGGGGRGTRCHRERSVQRPCLAPVSCVPAVRTREALAPGGRVLSPLFFHPHFA